MEGGQLPTFQLNDLIDKVRNGVSNRIWFFGAGALVAILVGVAGEIGLKNGHSAKNGQTVKIENEVPNPDQYIKSPAAAPIPPEKTLPETAMMLVAAEEEASPSDPDLPARTEPEISYEETLPETVHETATLSELEAPSNAKRSVIAPIKSVPNWRANAVVMGEIPPGPQIAIVIDDAGIDRHRTAQVIKLPGPLTISFLTYAGALDKQAAAAKKAGHELMVHMPMQPKSRDVDPGPNVLTPDAAPEETLKRILWGLDRFQGYVGVNNHMGSRFTEYVEGMEILLQEIKRRGLLFLDSRTSAKSVGAGIALAIDLPFAERNVFLDNVPEIAVVNKQLKLLENTAKRQGYAIAIGHPRDATIFALSQWLSVLAEKGFVQVPISTIVARRLGVARVTEVKN